MLNQQIKDDLIGAGGEQLSQRQRDCDEVDGERDKADGQ